MVITLVEYVYSNLNTNQLHFTYAWRWKKRGEFYTKCIYEEKSSPTCTSLKHSKYFTLCVSACAIKLVYECLFLNLLLEYTWQGSKPVFQKLVKTSVLNLQYRNRNRKLYKPYHLTKSNWNLRIKKLFAKRITNLSVYSNVIN